MWMKRVRSVSLDKMEELLTGLGCYLIDVDSSHDTYGHDQLTQAMKTRRDYFPRIMLAQKEEMDIIEVVKRNPMRKGNVRDRMLPKVAVIFRMYGVSKDEL